MKTFFCINFLITALTCTFLTNLQAQRIIKGTVYRAGKPSAGVIVEAHRGGKMTTGFEGKYEVEARDNSKWLKFTFTNESKKLNISDKTGDVFDFAFDGKMRSGYSNEETQDEVVLKTHEELLKDKEQEYINESSLYQEFYKINYFELALPHWKKIFSKYPKSSLNIYIHGVKMYESFIENAQNPQKRDKYFYELMEIYNKRIRHFNEKGYILGRKAIALMNYKLNTENTPKGDTLKKTLEQGYEWLNKAVTEQEKNIELPVLGLFMQTTRSLFILGELSKETVVKNYNTCINNLDLILEDSEDGELTKNVIDLKNYIEDIYGSSGAVDCEAIINIFTPRLKENSNDAEFIKSIIRRLRKAKCYESELFSQASEKLYELEPSAEAAFNMARRYVKSDETDRAKKYYQQAIEQETDNNLLANYYYEYAYFIYAKESALQESRSYARKALELNPDFCQALMLIGDIYVSASRNYGKDDFEKSTVFWLAVDYFERARRVGYDCSVDAAQKVYTYQKYFPDREEIFFQSLKNGQTYKLEGWINESTKVRF